MELLRYLSPTAMIPIAVIWFGIGEMSKYFLIFWGTFFIVLVNTTAGVWSQPQRSRWSEGRGPRGAVANQHETWEPRRFKGARNPPICQCRRQPNTTW